MSEDTDGHVRDPNREQLRELASFLAPESWVESIDVFPANRPTSLSITLLPQHYPDGRVDAASLEIQSYTNGEFHISYLEDQHGTDWMCRWDRHESDEYATDHFHAPPQAGHDDGEDRAYPVDLIDVLTTVVVPWIHERIGVLWEETNG